MILNFVPIALMGWIAHYEHKHKNNQETILTELSAGVLMSIVMLL